MYEIRCPKCGEVFQVEKAAYAEIVEQVRNEQFSADVEARVRDAREKMEAEQKVLLTQQEQKLQRQIDQKNREIDQLKAQAESAAEKKELAVAQAVQEKNSEIGQLKLEMEKDRNAAEKQVRDLLDEHKRELADKDAEIERLQNYKLKQSTKMIGESLEIYCKNEFDAVRMMAFRNAYFEKDNDDKEGSKADFVYREEAEDGTPLLSITFEMKNEADATATKHRNTDFLKKLDEDRKKNGTEYAVLVTMLEQDSELYNKGIVAAYQYPKMYIVRPQFFIQLISLLRDAALNSLQTRRELIAARQQNLDVQNFESALLDFKGRFDKNVRLAGENFEEAIKRIDESIKQMEKVKEALTKTQNNLRLANDKAQDLTIKKLTKDSPSVRDKFIEAGADIK
ncbi:MAG: DUF2130 domain-containing protein [Clostridiales bacterium]|nr:DUF2130 domain-containing protein [Clostridiales bacterium]